MVAILRAITPQPEVLLLDEPAAGLDPVARRELIDELISVVARQSCTILFSTHIISDLERIAEYVGIMDRGRLLLSSRLDDLQSTTRRIQIVFPGEKAPADFVIPGAIRCETAGPVFRAITRLPDSQYLETLRRQPGVRVQTFPLSLEEIFIELLGQGVRDEVAEYHLGELGSPSEEYFNAHHS
jgi:ABC-2 type transport system ATP-binding protein